MTFIWDEFIDTTVNINSLSIQSLYDKNKDKYKDKKNAIMHYYETVQLHIFLKQQNMVDDYGFGWLLYS